MKQSEIALLLPEVFQRTLQPGSLLDALLAVMEGLHEPAEEVLANLDRYFDPYRAPDEFVPFLAVWVDLGWLLQDERGNFQTDAHILPGGISRLRELVAQATYLSKWRGTRHGLQRFLEIATGIHGFGIDDQVVDPFTGQIQPFQIHIRAPPAAQAHISLIAKVIDTEKPAYADTTFEFFPKESN